MRHHALSPAAVALSGGTPVSAGARFVRFALDRFLLLPLGAAIALVWANTGAEGYFIVSQAFAFVVNDIAMALFFGLLTQEIVEELMPGGALHAWRRRAMPLVAAVGGTIVAPLTYLLYVRLRHETVLEQAWPAACVVDLVGTYYVLKTIRLRRGLLAFALLMAIAANGLVLLLIAPSYALTVRRVGPVLIALAVALAALLRRVRVASFWPYLAGCGTVSWAGFYLSGLQPALALVPIVLFLPHEARTLEMFTDARDDDTTHHAEHEWNGVVQVILFLFGLVNAGVVLRGYGTGTWALLTAGLVGRPVGMLLGVGVAMMAGLHLPPRIGWREVVVVALATSSGFTLALFVAVAVVPMGPVLQEIKLGALSVVVGAPMAFAVAWLLGVGALGRRRAHHR